MSCMVGSQALNAETLMSGNARFVFWGSCRKDRRHVPVEETACYAGHFGSPNTLYRSQKHFGLAWTNDGDSSGCRVVTKFNADSKAS